MNIDLAVEENVVNLMRSSKTESEWNNNCDLVKEANNGYPGWWYRAIILKGILGKTRLLGGW